MSDDATLRTAPEKPGYLRQAEIQRSWAFQVESSVASAAIGVQLALESSEQRLRHPSKLAYEANLREALRHLERARESLLEAASHLEQA